jgi:tRNA (guanine-N7-)-methyltransferase
LLLSFKMKPKDLKPRYLWRERKVYIEDSVFFIPSFYSSYEEFHFPGWEAVFQNQNPVNVECCSGNGMWIINKALESPSMNWVAVDLDFERVRKIWAKVKNNNLTNLFIVCGDANLAVKYYFPKKSVENVFINFPDPWPKNSHAKKRLMQREFVQGVMECMKEGGSFTLTTDDRTYSDRSIALLTQFQDLTSVFDQPYYTIEFPGYGSSYFEELWRSRGKEIRYHQFEKKSA